MSLRLSLTIAIGAVMALTLLLGSLVMYARAISKVETEIGAAIDVARRSADDVVANLPTPSETLRILPRFVARFDGHRHVRATFTASNGMEVQSRGQQSKALAPKWFVALFADAARQVEIQLPSHSKAIGKFTLTGTPRNEIEEVWGALTDSLLVLTVLCFAVPLLISWQLSRSLKPLEQLSRAFAKVGPETHPAPVPERGPKELLQVYRGFNKMVEGLATAEEKNRRLNKQLTAVQEEERADLARDLHDEIGPFLFAVDVDASTIRQLPNVKDNDDVTSRIDAIREAVKHMQGIVKSLLGRLRPGVVLLDLGLAPAVDNLIEFWRGRHPNITISSQLDVDDLGTTLNSTIYRIIQEALSNAIRHGTPQNIDITVNVRNSGTVKVTIADDGGGAEGIEQNTNSGFGLRGMRERVESTGGRFAAANRSDTPGVRIEAILPLDIVLDVGEQGTDHKQNKKSKMGIEHV